MNGYDFLAPVYDSIARLVFGSSIRDAQICFLDRIPKRGRVLILGGGTGWLLTDLLTVNPDCEVWYVESSMNMLARARRRKTVPNIHFIHGTLEDIIVKDFDAVITHFFLDLFSETTLERMIPYVLSNSKPTVLWLAADFVDRKKWWQTTLLASMYFFFRVFTSMEAVKLSAWDETLCRCGLKRVSSQHFYGKFIESNVYAWSGMGALLQPMQGHKVH